MLKNVTENAKNVTENAKNVTETAATREIIEGQSDGFCRLKQRSNSETRSVSPALINSCKRLCHRFGEAKREREGEKKNACPLILAVIKSVIREMVSVVPFVVVRLVFLSLPSLLWGQCSSTVWLEATLCDQACSSGGLPPPPLNVQCRSSDGYWEVWMFPSNSVCSPSSTQT